MLGNLNILKLTLDILELQMKSKKKGIMCVMKAVSFLNYLKEAI